MKQEAKIWSQGRRVGPENPLSHYVWLFLEAQEEAEHPLYLYSSLQLSISNHFWMLTPWKRQEGRKVKWPGQCYTGSCWQGWEMNSGLQSPPRNVLCAAHQHCDTSSGPPVCGCWDQGAPPAPEELCALPSTCPELQLSPFHHHKDWWSPMPGHAFPQLLLLLHKHHTGLAWSFLLMTLTSLLSASGSQWLSHTPCQPPPTINSFCSQLSSNISFVIPSCVKQTARRKSCTTRNLSPLESLLKTRPSGDLRRHCPEQLLNLILIFSLQQGLFSSPIIPHFSSYIASCH